MDIILGILLKNSRQNKELARLMEEVNPFIIDKSNLINLISNRDPGDQFFLSEFWKISDKKKVKLENVSYLFNTMAIQNIDNDFCKIISEGIIEHKLFDWVKQIISDQRYINNQIHLESFNFNYLLLQSIIKDKNYLKKFNRQLIKFDKSEVNKLKRGLLFEQFIRQGGLVNDFYSETEINNNLISLMGKIPSNIIVYGNSINTLSVNYVKKIINVGLINKTDSKELSKFYKRMIVEIVRSNYDQYKILEAGKILVDLLKERKNLKLSGGVEKAILFFIKKLEKRSEQPMEGFITRILAAEEYKKNYKEVIGSLEKELINANKKPEGDKLMKI